MMESADLLLELGTEELPHKSLQPLAKALAAHLADGLQEYFPEQEFSPQWFATPRRLAVRLSAVPAKQADKTIAKLGPAAAVAFDADGQPTKAAQGFARSCGVSVEALQRLDTDKGKRLAFNGTQAGQNLAQIFPAIVTNALKHLPIARRMRWGAESATFVRPVHWVVALHGTDVIPLTLFGHSAGRTTYGHRFHHPQAITLASPADYEQSLRTPGHVVVAFEQRRHDIREQVEQVATQLGGTAVLHADLLDDVTALVEWPVALAGSFDPDYLQLPAEVLTSTLEGHQWYFTVADANGTLLPHFITVANLDSRDRDKVIAGNERVVHPRLADALFFWTTDRKRGLPAYAAELDTVTFQHGLGTLADKSRRLATLGAWLAGQLGAQPQLVERAAALAKADLLCEMVGEFPDLQGIMGRYYAANEDGDVAQALQEQYEPRHAGAPIAKSQTGRVLALADRLDTLAGIFSLGKRPTGDKDPFALRRNALAVLRTLIEGALDLDLPTALQHAIALQPDVAGADALVADLQGFHQDRLRGYYIEQGITPAVFAAVAANGLKRPLDFDRRIHAVSAFLSAGDAQQLCSAHKRIRNILKGTTTNSAVDPLLLTQAQEKALFNTLTEIRQQLEPLTQQGRYSEALHALAQLQQPVDAFFSEVMVMADDDNLRNNRLALLAQLDQVCCSIADISQLSPQ